jgi:hypothetical protein
LIDISDVIIGRGDTDTTLYDVAHTQVALLTWGLAVKAAAEGKAEAALLGIGSA